MRSVTRAAGAAALALALAGCGNYSTEDLRFLAALPRREDLRVAVPAQGTPTGLVGPCATRPAEVWLWAKPTSDGLNAGVEVVLSLVDAVRAHPPTWRKDDARGWGPFDDGNHPGREIRIVIVRTFPESAGGEAVYVYAFQARVKGTQDFADILTGAFEGGSARTGRGGVALDFDAMWTLGLDDAETPHGTMQIAYDRTSDPVTIGLTLAQDGFGVVRFGYGYAGYADRRGTFGYRFRDRSGDVLTVETGFDAAGAGRASVGFVGAGGGTGSFRQCWDANACLVYVDDPGGYSCGAPPCGLGALADCPAVPASPF
jgi:hypothetical protein